jgi:uncharacterized protein Yka (UPF0111/DUF47 family)
MERTEVVDLIEAEVGRLMRAEELAERLAELAERVAQLATRVAELERRLRDLGESHARALESV